MDRAAVFPTWLPGWPIRIYVRSAFDGAPKARAQTVENQTMVSKNLCILIPRTCECMLLDKKELR